jgi:hypothetical protein
LFLDLASHVVCHFSSPSCAVEWLNAEAEAEGKESVEISPFSFRHGDPGTSTVCLQLENLPLPLIYLRLALIQVGLDSCERRDRLDG